MPRQSVYHSLLTAFRTEVITRALAAAGGNRTHAARLLGLQRTYLLRLMRDRRIHVPRPQRKGRSGDIAPASGAAPPGLRVEITGWEPLAPPNGDSQHPGIAAARPPETEGGGAPCGAGQAAHRDR
jgi:hypothetical protein